MSEIKNTSFVVAMYIFNACRDSPSSCWIKL